MIRQDVVINNYRYIVDVYKAETADLTENRYAEFVILRNYEFSNEIIKDKDIYVIEKSLLDEYKQNYGLAENKIIFPKTNKDFTTFSTNYKDFNSNYFESTFIKNNYEQYDLYKKTSDGLFKIESLPCDKVKLYHPHNKTHLKAIVYFDNYINSVHFHWFCRPINALDEQTYAETPFTIDNIHYSEYIELWLPSPEKIINKEVFFKENLNVIEIGKETNIDESYKSLINVVKDENDNDKPIETYVSTYIFTLPYMVENDKKIFLPEYKQTVINNYISYPLNVTLYPYSEIDLNNIYLPDKELVQNSDTFYSEVKFSLAAKLGLDGDNGVSIINTFNYPNKENFKSFKDAYQYYFNVDLSDYEGIFYYDEENEDEDDAVEQKQCGFELAIYKDYNKKYRIYKSCFEINSPDKELDDFAFQLSGIFQNWDQLPEFLVCQTRFIDKYLGHTIVSNQFMITKEWFKYLINDSETNLINLENEQQKLIKISDMDLSKINFIDKINCVIKREAKENDTVNYNIKNTPRVIYRPIFFKTADLQNIQIRTGFVQNVGINLSEYMSKVDSFNIIIGDTINLVEYARNDVYVIFKIDPSLITNISGQYHITNQDGEYISSGKYTII